MSVQRQPGRLRPGGDAP